MLITSRSNPLIIETASLKEKKYRQKSSLFVFEGVKLFDEAVKRGVDIVRVFATERMTEYCKNSPFEGEIITVSDSVYEKLSNEKSPEGIICAAKYIDKSHNMNKIYTKEEFAGSEKRVIILSSLRDPGNLGTIIRSASAFGVDEIILSSDCADIYNPKTVRAAMGTLFSQCISYVDDLSETVRTMNEGGYTTLAAVLDDKARPLNDIEIGKKTALIIGNEGHGIAPDVIESASGTVYIPMEAGVESLNAAIAASVFMWQAYKG